MIARAARIGLILPVVATLLALPAAAQCTDRDGDRHCSDDRRPPSDCNDDSPSTYTGAPEYCNNVDDDCNGIVDDAVACTNRCTELVAAGETVWLGVDLREEPEVLWARRTFVALRQTDTELELIALGDAGGEVFGSLPVFATELRALWTGSRFALFYGDSNYHQTVWLQFLTAHGDPIGDRTRALGSTYGAALNDAMWNGEEFGVSVLVDERQSSAFWQDHHFVRIDRDGSERSQDQTDYVGYPFNRAIVTWTGRGYLRASSLWGYPAWRGQGIYREPVSRKGTIETYQRVDLPGQYRHLAGFAWNGRTHLLTWIDQVEEDVALWMATPLDAWGQPIGESVELPFAGPAESLVWIGHAFAVLVHNDSGVTVRLLAADGNPFGTPLEIAGAARGRLAWNGEELGVAWRDAQTGQLGFQRVDCTPRNRRPRSPR